METHQQLAHASSFGRAAAAYAAYRPDYPQAAVRWALEGAPGPRVLDLGAGTGKLTATDRRAARPAAVMAMTAPNRKAMG